MQVIRNDDTFDLGTDKEGFGFGGTGKKSFGRQFDSYGEVNIYQINKSKLIFKLL